MKCRDYAGELPVFLFDVVWSERHGVNDRIEQDEFSQNGNCKITGKSRSHFQFVGFRVALLPSYTLQFAIDKAGQRLMIEISRGIYIC